MNAPEPSTDFNRANPATYERRIRVLIPGYNELHGMAAAALGATLAKRARVLVSGAGTGVELAHLARVDSSLRVTAVDPSGVMLNRASERCGDLPFEVGVTFSHCKQQDFAAEEPFDGAMSVLVSHFMRDDGSRQQYYADLRGALSNQGVLVLAEFLSWPDCTQIPKTWRFLARQAGWDEGEISLAERRMALESFTRLTEPRLIQLLTQAGFTRVERLSQLLDVGLYFVEC